MLPPAYLSYRRRADGVVEPRWLEPRDEPWLRELLAVTSALAGQRVSVAKPRLGSALGAVAERHGASRRVVQGVWLVERRRWRALVASKRPPPEIRKVLFPLAAERAREEALAMAGEALGLSRDEVVSSLFADRPTARVLTPPEGDRTTRDLMADYNLALARGLLARSTEVVATVRANVRSVIGYAQLRSLMSSIEAMPDGTTRVSVSGPLALFHDTLKYGRALALWSGAVAATAGWQLEARVLLGKHHELGTLTLDGSTPLPRTHELPRAHDSKLEARLEADVRALGGGWSVSREGTALRIGGRLFFPDFVLTKDGVAVHVEIVGFWTPEYLAQKARVLTRAGAPVVFCVDERHAHGALAAGAQVITFRGRVDASALLDACERARAAPRVVAPTPARYHVIVPDDPRLASAAKAGGARAAFWMLDVVDDLTHEGDALRVRAGPVHPEHGPLFALRGKAFYVEAYADPERGDTLLVYRIVALTACPAASRGPWRERDAALSPLDVRDVARAPPGDDVRALYAAVA